jgi:hypothetical protein
MNDDLRARLQSIDPMPPEVPTESLSRPEGRQQLENIMATPTIQRTTTPGGPGKPRGVWFAAAAAALVAVVAIGAIAMNSSDDAPVAGPPLELTTQSSDVMSSCIMVSPEILADVEVGFAGTVTAIDDEQVTLEVTKWYVGGTAETVVVSAPSGLEALIGSVPFALGEDFLVSATNGVVNYCGLSGQATPDMQAMYDAAFPG